MVSEYKATQNPIHHELTPGENEVSKPPQLDFETSVVGKFKGPITTTKVAPPPSMGGLLSTWKHMLWLIHHLNQKKKIGVPHSKELKPTRTYHTVSTMIRKARRSMGNSASPGILQD